jgi:pimeloyl-ACP methyl ester carboxylesterase
VNVSKAGVAGGIAGIGGLALVYGFAREMIDATREFQQLVMDPVFFGRDVPRGDGHPVVAIPGFLANDGYLCTLRDWLSRMGYTAVASAIRRNYGRLEPLIDQVRERTAQSVRESGTPATLLGHSLGGVIACGVAEEIPEAVRQVIAIGSPLRVRQAGVRSRVPLTAIRSRDDRIVRGERALAPGGSENLEVGGSHIGLVFNAQVYRHLGRLLSASSAADARTEPLPEA